MPTHPNWVFINTFAGWLSAIGTLAAVVVSLYLALRDSRIRLRVNVGLWKGFGTGNAAIDNQDFVVISVTNIGRRAAKVTNLYWKNRFVFRKGVIQIPGEAPWSSQLPMRLQDGEEANFTIRLKVLAKNNSKTFEPIMPMPRWLTARFIRMEVRTSTGRVFRAPPEKELRQWLMNWIDGKPTEPRV